VSKILNVELHRALEIAEYGGANMMLLKDTGEVVDISKPFAQVILKNTNIIVQPGTLLLAELRSEEHTMPMAWIKPFIDGLSGKEISFVISFTQENLNHYWEINFNSFLNAEGHRCIIALTRDISRQKRAESKLIEQNKELKKINSELDRFVYSASHDLRSPLMSIQGLINVLRLEEYNKDNFSSYLGHMERSIFKLDNFISSIVDYSHNSRLEVQLETINLNELIATALEKLQYLKEFEKVKIETTIDVSKAFVSDYKRLMVIILNIVANALQYRDQYKESFLKIQAYTENSKVILKFEDNGVGIAAQYVEKVFQMFFRANLESKGSGLGLYLAKEATERLKGTLSLQSQIGNGTTVFVELQHNG
jgi:signal transduction histidine kinase